LRLHQGVQLALVEHLLLQRKHSMLLQRHALHPLQRLHLLPHLLRTHPNTKTRHQGSGPNPSSFLRAAGWARMACGQR